MKRTINKNRVFYVVMGVLITVILIVTSIRAYKDFFSNNGKDPVSKKELENLNMYGYTLDDLDTPLYKTYFDDLKKILNEEEIKMEDYAEGLVKLYVTDFYTLSNKITSSDIGGVEFVHPDVLENFKLKASDTIYNHVKNNVYGDREQVLPTVKNVEIITCTNTKYSYNNNEYDAYQVSASWEYEQDLGYDKKGVFYLINDNSKLNIVEKE